MMIARIPLQSSLSATHFSPRRLALAGLAAAGASVVATVAIRAITVSIETVPSAFTPLHTSSVVLLTIFGVVGATVACLVLNALVASPLATFRRVVPIALTLSFIPDVLIWTSHAYDHTARASTVVPLLIMHVAVASICLFSFLGLGPRRQE
jgi:uncharacterized protein YacL